MSRRTTLRRGSLCAAAARPGLRVALVAACLGFATVTEASAPADLYTTAVRPLFEAKCLRCHSAKTRKGGLDLSTLEALLRGGEGGPVVVAGKPEESPLYELVHEGAMPAGPGNKLSPAEVETIRAWIEGGARGDSPATAATALPEPTQHDVYPILLRRCTVCHGRDVREGGLDLRTRAAMLRGGESGPAIVPNDPGKSLILEKIRKGEMPPLRRVVEASIKPIEPAETELIARWITLGAPERPIAPDVAGTEPDPMVTDADRNFWAFRPPKSVAVPIPSRPELVRNPIDAFILERLEAEGLTLAPEADRLALLRRVTLDLTGLPPEPEEIDAFLGDHAPDAYERLVDRLLASPRHGERWGRHWLDVAGYADSEGKREQDLVRPFAWRYRDYVVRALNADKPYDRFLTEQIAGDELADYEHAPEITREIEDNLVATGFLRMAPDPTWANPTNFLPDRVDVIADEMDVLGSGVLGLTLKCARCHSHKIDPIPQRDYYRLLDVFKGAYDENDWLRSGWEPAISKGRRSDREMTFVNTLEHRRWETREAELTRQVESLKNRRNAEQAATRDRLRSARLAPLSESTRDALASATAIPGAGRHAALAFLVRKFDAPIPDDPKALAALDPTFKATLEQIERDIKAIEAKREPEPTIRALWDRGEPSPTYIARRGDPMNPGTLVGPGVPSVLTDGRTPFEVSLPWPGARSTGRRLAFARWLTRPDHPLTARVMVNRVWKHHFQNGLVATLGNFGKAGTPPSHPALLDWLATEFVRRGWSLKALHRLIVTSATYRQSSVASELSQGRDPDGRLYSRFPLKRVEAEVLYDSLLRIAGRLDPTPFGPPDAMTVRADGLVTPTAGANGWRRGIYLRQVRKNVTTILEVFDLPLMNPNCLERRDSNVPTQALHLWNDGLVRTLADAFAGRVEKCAGDDPGRQVEEAFRLALGRPPDPDERAASLEALGRFRQEWARLATVGGAASCGRKALGTFCHTLLNSAAFLYVD